MHATGDASAGHLHTSGMLQTVSVRRSSTLVGSPRIAERKGDWHQGIERHQIHAASLVAEVGNGTLPFTIRPTTGPTLHVLAICAEQSPSYVKYMIEP